MKRWSAFEAKSRYRVPKVSWGMLRVSKKHMNKGQCDWDGQRMGKGMGCKINVREVGIYLLPQWLSLTQGVMGGDGSVNCRHHAE